MTERTGDRAARDENVMWTLAAKAWVFRGRVILAVVLLVVAKIAAVTVPLVLKRIVDAFSQPEGLVVFPLALLVGYAAVRFATTLFGELRDLTFVRVAQTAVADYTQRVFNHLHALGARFHTNRSTGALTRDVERGTSSIGFLLNVALFTVVPTLVEISIVVVILSANYSAGFPLIILATFIAYSLFSVVFTRRRAIRQRRVNELDSNAHSRLVDSVLNYDTVKFYSREEHEASRFGAIMRDWIEAGVANQRALTLLHVGQSATIALGVGAVMVLAGRGVFDGTMTVGDLVLVNAYVIQVCLPLNSLGFVFREATDALVKAERLFALLREPPEVEPDANLPVLDVARGEVHFENVSFGYEPNRPVLSGISFRIAPGSTVAVVGGSGSGKSTLARLLLRFYEPWTGRVEIDGQAVNQVAPSSVRAAIGVVPQEASLFNDTIGYNIAYGRAGATQEEIVEAAKSAGVHAFIESLPLGYDTQVGERGLKLSGGEKQRIAIARALLKNPPILVLDEATSALDMRSERAIQTALERLARERTTLTIAHRLATVVHADEILVLEAGRILERGRHDELIERDGLYAQMWSLQEQERALRRLERRASRRPLNLATVISGAVEAARPAIEARGVQLFTSLGLDVGLVTGDPGALQEVVYSLLVRSVAASGIGARVEVSLERVGNEIEVRIADTVPSVPGSAPAAGTQSIPPAAFDGDSPNARAGDVQGRDAPSVLGVRAIEAVVVEHQGRVRIDRDQTGTRVSIVLPVRAVAAEPWSAIPAASHGDAEALALGNAHVVIVDDDEDARVSLGALLAARGATVEAFGGGQETMVSLRAHGRAAWPDLLVCDIGLPDEDGYALLRRIRALEAEEGLPLSERMPAIALTGYARAEDRVRAMVAGFQAHVAKPAQPKELLETIDRLLHHPRPA